VGGRKPLKTASRIWIQPIVQIRRAGSLASCDAKVPPSSPISNAGTGPPFQPAGWTMVRLNRSSGAGSRRLRKDLISVCSLGSCSGVTGSCSRRLPEGKRVGRSGAIWPVSIAGSGHVMRSGEGASSRGSRVSSSRFRKRWVPWNGSRDVRPTAPGSPCPRPMSSTRPGSFWGAPALHPSRATGCSGATGSWWLSVRPLRPLQGSGAHPRV